MKFQNLGFWNVAVKEVPGGVVHIDGLDSEGVLVVWSFVLDRLTICINVLSLCMVAWTDDPVTSKYLLNHDCPFGSTPVGIIIPCRNIPLRRPPLGTIRALKNFR